MAVGLLVAGLVGVGLVAVGLLVAGLVGVGLVARPRIACCLRRPAASGVPGGEPLVLGARRNWGARRSLGVRRSWGAERSLGALRIGVCLAFLLEDSAGGALVAAQLPRELLQWPELLASLTRPAGALLPHATSLVWAFRVSVVCVLFGVGTRMSLAVATVLGWLVLPLAQLVGPTVHNHHLLWFLTLLSFGPTPDWWSVDRLLSPRGFPQVTRTKAAPLALLMARMLLACVYFFPGFWKLRESGLEWLAPQSLIQLFHLKWYEFGFVPAFRIDQVPGLLVAGGACVVLLELSFPLLVQSPRGRNLALLGGLGFHIFASQFLRISFAPLWLCYGILIDWDQVLAWLRDETWVAPPASMLGAWALARKAPLLTFVGVTLLLGTGIQGARGAIQAWPFACYPTFQWLAPAALADVVAVWAGQAPSEGFPSPAQARLRSQQEWGRVYRLVGSYGDPVDQLEAARGAYVRDLAERGLLGSRPEGAPEAVELHLVRRPTDPTRWNEMPAVNVLLGRYLTSGAAGSD